MWKKWNGTKYERMPDDEPDIFDAVEQIYRSKEQHYRHDTGTADLYNKHKPELIPEPVKPRERKILSGKHGKKLQALDKRVVVLHDCGGLSFRLVGLEIGLSMSTATGIYYRARAKILRQAADYQEWIDEQGIDVDAWNEEVA